VLCPFCGEKTKVVDSRASGVLTARNWNTLNAAREEAETLLSRAGVPKSDFRLRNRGCVVCAETSTTIEIELAVLRDVVPEECEE
jgi:transcriptional regulator NrdR family protein